MLYICGIYAWLGSKDLAIHLRAIYSNVAAMFIVSICYIEGMDIQPILWS